MEFLEWVLSSILDEMTRLAWQKFKQKLTTYIVYTARLIKSRGQLPASIHDIKIVHKSPHYIIVSKHYDVLINSNSEKDTVTVQTQLRRLYPDLVNPRLGHEFLFSHRLDFSTSGLLCISVHKQAAAAVTKCFVKKIVDKYYLAILRGHLSKEMLDVYLPIGEDTREEWSRIKMTTSQSPYAGKCRNAHTRILVLQKGLYDKYPATKVLMKPITGRRHQLRVHCSESGHSIVGDYTYSNRRDLFPYRMFLHAYRMIIPSEFEHIDVCTKDPFTKEDPRNLWQPVETLNELDEEAFTKLKLGWKWNKR
ncbi:unnamed protein product [Meganyctiphanes norvegica]|uniref:Pseudouridine synthase RsuA/RluA-like domain-containing protein n=1 Tax=Meganyctiphanes norvegica TaxID=48144 RepID=A0AAV2SMG0_MEGNR